MNHGCLMDAYMIPLTSLTPAVSLADSCQTGKCKITSLPAGNGWNTSLLASFENLLWTSFNCQLLKRLFLLDKKMYMQECYTNCKTFWRGPYTWRYYTQHTLLKRFSSSHGSTLNIKFVFVFKSFILLQAYIIYITCFFLTINL